MDRFARARQLAEMMDQGGFDAQIKSKDGNLHIQLSHDVKIGHICVTDRAVHFGAVRQPWRRAVERLSHEVMELSPPVYW